MLKNTFRKLTGGIILVVFLIAVFQFVRQTQGNQLVGGALLSGLGLLLFLGLVLGGVYLLDRRMKKHQQ